MKLKSDQPNLIVILADDMGFSDIGCFGSEISTPNLDLLGVNGIRLTQLYNSARCCPTRASILTGLSPQQAGIGHMVDDWGVGPGYQGWLREDTVTIGEALKTGGYRTMYSGKWHVNWSFEAQPGEPSDSHHHKLGQTGYPHPRQRGFDDVYALMTGATSLFNPQHLIKQDQWIQPEQPGYYITDNITDQAIEMMSNNEASGQPFFLHLCHIAPHWPLHALAEDIQKYDGLYDIGWDEIRRRRHGNLQDSGIIDQQWRCSERDSYAPTWDSLNQEEKNWQAKRMAVYAAMVDRMDQSIGRLIKYLQDSDQLDNTAILFLSDNGGCAEFLQEDGWCQWYDHPTWDGKPIRLGNDISIVPGPDDTFSSYDLPWANASNTPFRLFKHFVHEGGIATPTIISWPHKIKQSRICHSACHVQDIMPTLLQLAGVECPTKRSGHPVQAPSGESFADILLDQSSNWKRKQSICFEHEGNAAIRKNSWKAVCRFPDDWELYDMDADRTELNDLSKTYPQLLQQLIDEYQTWATNNGVVSWPPGEWPSWMSDPKLRSG